MSHFLAGDPADFKAFLDCCGRKAGPVLYSPETFLFECNDEFSITKKHS